ncbi:TnpV protein [Campylobacter coli]|uniref:TnpV protein n=1 Tax=Campylobacter coli TaxID=195 RepID=UPI0009A92187
MKQAQGITEQLKAENALEWTGCLNNIRACAREIVEKEIFLHKQMISGRGKSCRFFCFSLSA